MLWIKALHIISVICWFAGIFYMPRLFVYHSLTEDEVSNERFKVMERKLYHGIMYPAMIATLVFGIWLTIGNWDYYKTAGWFHAKLLLLILLVGYHHYCGILRRQFELNQNDKSHVFYRWFNELPFLALVSMVILVVVKPF